MDTVYPHCAGLDVHKDTVVACVRHHGGGRKARQEVRTFATHTRALEELADWLTAEGVTHAAMESTGVYWKPVFNVLEGRVTVLLVNPQHIKQVPGRKTDVGDCAWIAQLLQHGLLTASFIRPARQRELRDLTRQRSQLGAEQTAVANRIQKILEDANVKFGSVVTDILGVSGRAILAAIVAGQADPGALAELARGRLRGKIPQLRQALRGRVTDHHRFLLRLLLEHLDHLDRLVAQLDARIELLTAPDAEALTLLTTIPGIKRHTAEVLLAEVGPNVDPFPTAGQFASWAGMCPGNNESAGKRRTGRTRRANRWLRQAVVQAGWAASHSKTTYLGARYRRVARRRGAKRALMAVGHTLLVIVYQVLRRREAYREIGANYYDRLQPERLARHLVHRLEQLGHTVTLEARPTEKPQPQAG
ncbi:MAG TPA: IS110 family transposase [Fimbriiglobus sp.]|nr:IS110 family transposase [Fimbriiglobus sp.]